MSIHIRRVASFAELYELREDWNTVAAATPFGTWQWLHTWAESFIREEDLYLLVAETDSRRLVGVLPLYRDTSLIEGRVLRWLGSGSVCTDHMTLFAAAELSASVGREMAHWLNASANDYALGWDSMVLDQVAEGDLGVSQLSTALQSQGCELMRTPGMNGWRVELPGSWEEYLASFSKSHRKQVRRIERELLDTGRAQLHTAESESELQHALEVLIELHQKRRNRLGQPGCFACDRFRRFLCAASKRLLAAGMLRLHWMEVAGRAVAAEWQLTDGKTTFAYQAGIDPDAMDLEPGRLIMIATLRQAIASGQRSFDFLRGDEPYKAHFRATPQATNDWRFIPPTGRAQTRHALFSAGRTVKQWLKSAVAARSGEPGRATASPSAGTPAHDGNIGRGTACGLLPARWEWTVRAFPQYSIFTMFR